MTILSNVLLIAGLFLSTMYCHKRARLTMLELPYQESNGIFDLRPLMIWCLFGHLFGWGTVGAVVYLATNG